jgi:beta-lactamase superfamily II metal-dependent hydrolase
VPFAAVSVTAPSWLALAWYPVLGIAWRRLARAPQREPSPDGELLPLQPAKRRSSLLRRVMPFMRSIVGWAARPVVGVAGPLVLLAALTVMTLPDGRLHLVALDVGQGDAMLVTTPTGATMLVDGGPDPDLLLRRLGEHLPWWRRRIDVMVLTHPHEDHVAGLVAALERYRVGLILDGGRSYENPTYPRFLREAISEPGGRLAPARAGAALPLDPTTTVTLLYPTEADAAGSLPEGDINNASVVSLVRSGGFSALLTGDAELPVEALLAERGLLTRVDVLKVGHHGSHSSTSPALLSATNPAVALISAGVDNDYGHPHQVTLDSLHRVVGLRLHRTDLEGSIEVISDGRRFEVVSRTAVDPWRAVVARTVTAQWVARRIGAWPFPPGQTLSGCSPPSTSLGGSSRILRVSAASRPRRRASCRMPGYRSIRASSRSPPCCTTSISSRPGMIPASMD